MVTSCGFSVSIQVGGVDLPEYSPEYNIRTNTAKCYVPSEAGREYTICVKRQDTDSQSVVTHARVKLYLDGIPECIAKSVLRKESGQVVINSVRVSDTSVKPFVFALLETTDDDSQVTSMPANPGDIRIDIQRILLEMKIRTGPMRKAEPNEYPGFARELAEQVVVHETHKKAGGLRSSFGPSRQTESVAPTGPPSRYQYTIKPYSKEDEKPFVSFIFLHRTEAILRAGGIMPCSRSPSVVEISEDDSTDGDEGSEEHKARIRALEAKQAELDAERDALKAKGIKGKRKRSFPEVKEEDIQPHRFFQPGEVVDMTHL